MKGKKKWRLSKTLSRRVEVRPIEDDDVRYVWAAYRLGSADLNKIFPEGMSAADFKFEFEKFILANMSGAWTVLAETKKGYRPVAIVTGHAIPLFMFLSGIVWFPWASKRNLIEGVVAICKELGKQFPLLGFVPEENKKVWETAAIHGVAHRIGTSHRTGEKMTVWESRTNVQQLL